MFHLLVGSHRQTDEVFVLHGGCSFHLAVSNSEGICEPLDLNAADNEVVQSHPLRLGVVFGQNVLDESWSEAISHLLEGSCQFCLFNSSGPVRVVTFEHAFPLINTVKECVEFVQIYGARIVGVVHIDHHPARFLAEVTPVAVDQRPLEFLG